MYKDKMGRFLTQSLFYELSYADSSSAIYTLKDEDVELPDGRILKSIKRLYLEISDPTEYEFALKCFYSWEHWQRLVEKTSALHPHIKAWREELKIKLRSQGVARMKQEALGESKSAASAAKWLADKGWEEPKKVGRPSKEEVSGRIAEEARVKQELESDLERVLNTRH